MCVLWAPQLPHTDLRPFHTCTLTLNLSTVHQEKLNVWTTMWGLLVLKWIQKWWVFITKQKQPSLWSHQLSHLQRTVNGEVSVAHLLRRILPPAGFYPGAAPHPNMEYSQHVWTRLTQTVSWCLLYVWTYTSAHYPGLILWILFRVHVRN